MKHIVKTKPGIISKLCEENGISKKQLCSGAGVDFRMIQKMDKGEFIKIIYLQRIVEFFDIPNGIVSLISDDKNLNLNQDLSGFVNIESFNNNHISPIALFNLTQSNCDTWVQEIFRRSAWDSQFQPIIRNYIVDDESISKELANDESNDDSLKKDLLNLENEFIKLRDKNFSEKNNNLENDEQKKVFRPSDFRMNNQLEKINSNTGISGIIRKLRDEREIFVSIGRYYFYEEEEGLLTEFEYPGMPATIHPSTRIKFFIPRGIILFVVSKIPLYIAQVNMGWGFPYYKNLTHYPGLENDITFTPENFIYLKEIRNGNRSLYQNEDFTDMRDVLTRTRENSQPTGIETLETSFEENFNFLNNLSKELTYEGIETEILKAEIKEKKMP